VSGTSGVDGTSGVSGSSGTSGVSGSSGSSGASGTSGVSGTSGINGTSGVNGTSGINGTSGTSGVNGTSGSSGTTPVGQITGTLTTNKIPKATGANTIGDSIITEASGSITVSGAAVDNYVASFINTDPGSAGIYVKADGPAFVCEPLSLVGGITLNANGSASFSGDITANKFIKIGGTSSQYLLADGSVSTGPSLAGYVPYTGATANVNLGVYSLTATGITVAKSAGVSTITFPAGTNDPAFISHTESTANTGIMRFSVGDDDDTIDYFIFGNTVTPDRFRINANGTVSLGTWQATAIADAYIASAATWNAKQNAITLTTTGSSGAATLTGATLNIPNYGSALTGYVPYTGATTNVNLGAFGLTATTLTDGLITISSAQINRADGFVEMQFTGAQGVKFFGNTAYPITFRGGTGNVIIGATTDAGFKLDVNGTGRFSGALSGTSATFSGAVTTSTSFVSNVTNGYGLILNRAAVGNYNGISLQTASSGQWFIGMRENLSSNNFIIYNENGTDALTIAKSNSAATFSSSVTANSLIIRNSGVPAAQFYRDLDVTVVGTAGQGIEFGARSGSTFIAGAAIYGGLDNPATTGNLVFQTLNGGTLGTRLTLANTGAATFTNRVQALNFFSVGSLNSTDGSFFIDHPGIQTWKIGVTNSNTSTFSIGNDNGGAFATKIFNITNSGNVLITNSNTNTQLVITNTSTASTTNKNTLIQFQGTDTVGSVKDSGAIQVIPDGVNYIGASMLFYTRGGDSQNERMRITNLGTAIGVAAPILTASDRGNLTINGSGASILTLASAGTFNMYIYSTSSFNEIYSTPKLWLGTAGSTRISIETNGNVLIGTTTDAGYKLNVNGTIRVSSSSLGLSIDGGSGTLDRGVITTHVNRLEQLALVRATVGTFAINITSGGSAVLVGQDTSTNILSMVLASGASTFISSVTATSFFESSDNRLKTLIEHNPIVNGIENLQAKLYEKNGKIELGYFAQDAEKIMPYAVTKGTDGFLSLSYREVHTAKIARLEKELEELKAKLN
jgi:hypothetical protein